MLPLCPSITRKTLIRSPWNALYVFEKQNKILNKFQNFSSSLSEDEKDLECGFMLFLYSSPSFLKKCIMVRSYWAKKRTQHYQEAFSCLSEKPSVKRPSKRVKCLKKLFLKKSLSNSRKQEGEKQTKKTRYFYLALDANTDRILWLSLNQTREAGES